MLNLAPQFGCAVGDIQCYCQSERFGLGIRDCANEACPDQTAAQSVIAYGAQYCASECSYPLLQHAYRT
jgi:hypothetical protein